MANGRAAALEPHDALAGEPFLAIGEIVGRAAAARIVAAAPLTLEQIEAVAGDAIETREETVFDKASASLRARRRRGLGALTLAEGNLAPPADDKSAQTLALGLIALGLVRLPWTIESYPMARPGKFPAPRRGRALARSHRRRARRLTRLADAVPRRQDAARRVERRGTCSSAARAAAPRSHPAAGSRGAEPFHCADRRRDAGRLRSGGRPKRRAARAGALWSQGPSRAGGRASPFDIAPSLAGASTDPDHARSAWVLERLMGGDAGRSARSLSASRLAGRSRQRRTDQPREAARDVRRERCSEHGLSAARLLNKLAIAIKNRI